MCKHNLPVCLQSCVVDSNLTSPLFGINRSFFSFTTKLNKTSQFLFRSPSKQFRFLVGKFLFLKENSKNFYHDNLSIMNTNLQNLLILASKKLHVLVTFFFDDPGQFECTSLIRRAFSSLKHEQVGSLIFPCFTFSKFHTNGSPSWYLAFAGSLAVEMRTNGLCQ